MQNTERQDIYTRITNKIVASLEAGVRPWIKPWSGENAAGKITRPLRHNGMPYSGINILMLWASAMEQGFGSPSWMTFKQAIELNAHVRKGEKGSLVVYANSVTKTERNDAGEDVEREIHFLKGYTVFNVEQIEGLPEQYYVKPEPKFTAVQRIDHAEAFFASTRADIRYRVARPITLRGTTTSRCRRLRPSRTPKASMRRSPMKASTGRSTLPALSATSGARAGATKAMRPRNWSRSLVRPSCAATWNLHPRFATITPPISVSGSTS